MKVSMGAGRGALGGFPEGRDNARRAGVGSGRPGGKRSCSWVDADVKGGDAADSGAVDVRDGHRSSVRARVCSPPDSATISASVCAARTVANRTPSGPAANPWTPGRARLLYE